MVMATATRTQNRYDHGLRELVRTTQDVSCAVQYGVLVQRCAAVVAQGLSAARLGGFASAWPHLNGPTETRWTGTPETDHWPAIQLGDQLTGNLYNLDGLPTLPFRTDFIKSEQHLQIDLQRAKNVNGHGLSTEQRIP